MRKNIIRNAIAMVLILPFLMMSACEPDKKSELSKMEFANIPQMAFEMGDPNGDSDEPLHTVVLTQEFKILKTEVTQRQWFEVMGYNPSSFKGGEGDRNKLGNNPDHPVENVSWNEIQEFIVKLNERKDGYRYRLPTEAEWEYAARAGTTTTYFFGDDEALLSEYGWFSLGQTYPVAQKKPNSLGLFDMHGNVWEWVLDPYSRDYSEAVSQERAAEVQASSPLGLYYVIRGGSSFDKPRRLRSANRERITPDGRTENNPGVTGVGFRLLRTK